MNYPNKSLSQNILTFIIIIALIIGISLYYKNLITKKNSKSNIIIDNEINEELELSKKNKVNLNIIDIAKPIINIDSPNKMTLEVNFNLDYNKELFYGITLSGYCTGINNEIYEIIGPADEITFYFNDDDTLGTRYMQSSITDIVNLDGTITKYEDVDWSKVNIKSCTIDKMRTYPKDQSGNVINNPLTKEIEYTKEFITESNLGE